MRTGDLLITNLCLSRFGAYGILCPKFLIACINTKEKNFAGILNKEKESGF